MTCCKFATWDRRLYFPSEGGHVVDFFVRPDSNPRSWVPEASMLTTKPPKPLDEPGISHYNVNADFPELSVLHLISQSKLNYLMRDLSLSKIQAEPLASLRVWRLLQQDVKMSHRKRQESLSSFCSKKGELIYCKSVRLMQKLGCAHNSKAWRGCVYSFQFILKEVQLGYGNIQS
jgi:hypothetical protein